MVMKRVGTSRTAVTLIEVLFATGIALFGLIGIASLIGVAGKQASQSNAATVSQALANQWSGDFVVRGFNSSPNWRIYDDQVPPASTAAATSAARFGNFVNSGTLPFGTSAGGMRPALRHAICIDPLFFADPSNLTALHTSFLPSQAYRPGLFPHYQDNLDPLYDPFSSVVYPSAPVHRPRLLRVGLHDPNSTFDTLTNSQVNRMFLSFDDQVATVSNVDDPSTVADERDSSAAAMRIAGGGRFVSKGEYSWFATLCPRELLPGESAKSENLYTMSLVVTKSRDRVFFKPTSSGVNNVPNGERIASVSAAGTPILAPVAPLPLPNDFHGGSGGRVQLSASINTSSKLATGDWIMLSRYQSIGGSVVVRWYRVISLDAKPTETETLWSREVSLDGPDWVFDATTQATLVSNVATVFERVVEVHH